jgi:hypothetical protein
LQLTQEKQSTERQVNDLLNELKQYKEYEDNLNRATRETEYQYQG